MLVRDSCICIFSKSPLLDLADLPRRNQILGTVGAGILVMVMKIRHGLLAFLIVFGLHSFVFAQNCKVVFSGQSPHDKFDITEKLKEFLSASNNNFKTDRDLLNYKQHLDSSFTQAIQSLTKDQYWLDGGGGQAYALQDYIRQGGSGRVVNLAYEGPSLARQIELEKYSPQYSSHFGRFFEEYRANELPKAAVITDVMGAFSYSSRPDIVILKYLELLSDGGSIFIYTGHPRWGEAPSFIVNEHGKFYIADWLNSIPGIVFSEVQPGQFLIQRNSGESEVLIPELELIDFKRTFPPTRVFNIKQSKLKIQANEHAELAALRALEDVRKRPTFSVFESEPSYKSFLKHINKTDADIPTLTKAIVHIYYRWFAENYSALAQAAMRKKGISIPTQERAAMTEILKKENPSATEQAKIINFLMQNR